MLIMTLARYRHLARLSPTQLINAQSFGALTVGPGAIPHILAPPKISNNQSFGSLTVGLGSAHSLAPTQLSNSSSLGSLTIAIVPPATTKFSYTNTLGSGNRTSSITVTTSGGSVTGTVANLVDGGTSSSPSFSGAVTFTFDLGSAKIVKQARWKQTNTTPHGLYKWQGSNDNSSYTDIGSTFNLGNATTQVHHTLIGNTTAYRYYRLAPTTGSMSNSPAIDEVEFYIEGTTQDMPDTSYLYPCGGGANAGGALSGTGGNATNRHGVVLDITANYTPPDGTISNLCDGAVANSSADSTDFPAANPGSTNAIFTIDFQKSGKKHRLDGIAVEQNVGTACGTYKVRGSDDNSSWTDLVTGKIWPTDFNAVGGGMTFTNTAAYRYYRIEQTAGTNSTSPWLHELYLKCAPSPYSADAI